MRTMRQATVTAASTGVCEVDGRPVANATGFTLTVGARVWTSTEPAGVPVVVAIKEP